MIDPGRGCEPGTQAALWQTKTTPEFSRYKAELTEEICVEAMKTLSQDAVA